MGKRKLMSDVSSRHLRRIAMRTTSPQPPSEGSFESDVPDFANFMVGTASQKNDDTTLSKGSSFDYSCDRGEHLDEPAASINSSLQSPANSNEELSDSSDGSSTNEHEHSNSENGFNGETVHEPVDTEKKIIQSLVEWVFKFKISLVAVTALLAILSLLLPSLPRDARTLLKTPRSTEIRVVPPGEYWHRGLRAALVSILGDANIPEINLFVNVDGLPIAESSTSVLWPILCSDVNLGVFVVGIYHGHEKPHDANVFLEDFVKEAIELTSDGLLHNGRKVHFKIEGFVCDAPAKAFVLGTVYFNSRQGCSKCSVEGEFLDGRMCFLDQDAPLRTDEGFRSKVDEDYHKTDTILLSIPGLNPVTRTVLDYMHLVCEGVTKKMASLWLGGPLSVRLRGRTVKELNVIMENLSRFVPKEFARNPRSFRFVKLWKATEFRQFLLYTGPVALQNVLPGQLYNNFLTLHFAITLLIDKKYCGNSEINSYADKLLRLFVRQFMSLYGKKYVSHNVHNLIHLAADAKLFGTLDDFSSFRFESFLNQLLRLLQKSEKPLQQIMRRYSEREKNSFSLVNAESKNGPPILKGKHECGKLVEGCVGPQYLRASFPSFVLNIDNDADRCVSMKDGSIVLIENFALSRETSEPVLVGRILNKTGNLYTYPCDSAKIGIFTVRGRGNLSSWPLSEVEQKYVRLPLDGSPKKFAVFPLLHSTG